MTRGVLPTAPSRPRRRERYLTAATAAVVLLALSMWVIQAFPPTTASATFTYLDPQFTQSDYLMGFYHDSTGGPTGTAFNPLTGDIIVADTRDGNVYKFPTTGGVASSVLISSAYTSTPVGIAFGKFDGVHLPPLYVVRNGAHDVAEFDASTGAFVRSVASGFGHPIGITVGPASGDLFISDQVGSPGIYRVNTTTGLTSLYAASAAGDLPDGLAFDSDGSSGSDGILYVANDGGGTIVRVAPGGSSVTTVASVPGGPDGIAFGRVPPCAGFLYVNRNDGVITQIDISGPTPTMTDIATGGTRGDFVAVSPDHSLFVTQLDRVIRIQPPCFGVPPTLTPTNTPPVGPTSTATNPATDTPGPVNTASATATVTPEGSATAISASNPVGGVTDLEVRGSSTRGSAFKLQSLVSVPLAVAALVTLSGLAIGLWVLSRSPRPQ